jgi:hypothetical protein
MYSRLILPKRPLSKALLFFALLFVKLGLIAVLVMALFPAEAAPVRKARTTVAAPRPAPVPDTAPRVRVVVTTSLGVITAEVDREHAPITAGNFLRYVDQKRFSDAQNQFILSMNGVAPEVRRQIAERGAQLLAQRGARTESEAVLKAGESGN